MDRAFAQHVLAAAAEEGPEHLARARAWVEELPAVVDRWRRHWRLGPLTQVPASIHWVGRGVRDDGRPCVLKLAVPGAPQPLAEVHWLRRTAGQGHGAAADVRPVRLLDARPTAGAQLLELVEPGEPLAAPLLAAAGTARFAAADDAACEVIGSAARAVRRPAPVPRDDDERADPAGRAALGSVRGHLRELLAVAELRDPRHLLLPARLVEVAAQQGRHLLGTAAAAGQADALLHGDLHHDNVLSAAGGWVVIDPHGVVGEPAYEVAAAVYNPFRLGELAAGRAVVRCDRLAQASQLPEDRVRGWALVQAVLSAVWSLSGRTAAGDTGEALPGDVRHVLAVAERLAG
ncbi:aminoglycoside phosphotransferase family protein [Streptomyces sp. NP160]|uniref:aminoglycoside phosphotransferase family protein n=1 Tax=Streptomyces sp. NP160 TaxID=2586637 RepID=UPI0015D5C97F|nr:aminoglycoside phosphotransferase family protein [Streptomyces sp. NP160]